MMNKKYLDFATAMNNKNFLIKKRDKFNNEIKKDRKKNIIWSVMFCDINNLKITNDTIGHEEADKGIKKLAEIIEENIRTSRKDELIEVKIPSYNIRVGGDEFIIILPSCDKYQAKKIKERINIKIKERLAETKGLTLAIGISDSNGAKTFNKMIELAEERMYSDKNDLFKNMNENELELFMQTYVKFMNTKMGIKPRDKKKIEKLIKVLEEYKKE